MAESEASKSTLDIAKLMKSRLSLAQAAGVYDLFTASGEVWVEVKAAYVTVAGAGFTSLSVATDHTSPKSVVNSTAVGAVTKDASATIVSQGFILTDGKRIRLTLVGTGSAGEVVLLVNATPVTPGATLI